MKKNIILILSLFLIISLIGLTTFKTTKFTLAGIPKNEFLYAYEYPKNSTLHGYTIKDNLIYYLLENNNSYTLYKQDIYKEKSTYIRSITNNHSCHLDDIYIICSGDNSLNIYNLELLEIYSDNNITSTILSIVPYKDTFLKIFQNKITITQNKEDVSFRTLPFISNYVSYFSTSDNTYLLFRNLEVNTFYLYDINNNIYEEITYPNYKKYNNGFYFYDNNNYYLYDLINNKTNTYKINLELNIHTLNNHTLYAYNSSSKNLEIIDFDKNTIKTIKEENINTLFPTEDYLYFTEESNNNIYLLDLTNKTLKEESIKDYLKTQQETLTNRLQKLKQDYNLNFYIKEDATKTNYPDFTAEEEDNYYTITNALDKIEPLLTKFDANFYNSFYDDAFSGLNIYLTGDLTPSNTETELATPAAYSLTLDGKYMMVIDITEDNIPNLFCHELMHNIEFNIEMKNRYVFNAWDNYNPLDFYYDYSYNKPYTTKYTKLEEDKNNAYFIDSYSKTYPVEDRARIFENVCTSTDLKIYPNIYQKALYIKDEILKYYPTLKDTSLFESLN